MKITVAIESDDDIRRVHEMGGMQPRPYSCVHMRLDNPNLPLASLPTGREGEPLHTRNTSVSKGTLSRPWFEGSIYICKIELVYVSSH